MPANIDLAARTGGLLPVWLFILLGAVWALIILRTWKQRDTHPQRMPQSLAIGSLVVANLLFFWRPLFTGAHLPRGGGDLNSFFFSLHAYSAERIASGEFPLWNPSLHGGMPHLGNFQAALLYPPNLIAYLLAQPFSYATLEWLAISHYLIASIGTYLLLRALGAGRIGAVVGAIVFAYGGFFVAHLGHYSMISAAAWIPWLFWAVYRLVEGRSWWTAAVLAVLVFLTASGGHQQTLLFAMTGTGAWWLFLHVDQAGLRIPGVGVPDTTGRERSVRMQFWNRSGAASLAQFAFGTGTGLLLAAPMLLPSLQLAQRSVRSTLSVEQASEFSVQPVALLQLLLPTVFGSNPTDYWGAFSSGEIWGYVGVTTLIVAVIGLALRPTTHRLFFAAMAVLALLYAVGPAAPIHGWFYQFVPGFDFIRAPARSYLYLNLAVAVLAGLAVSDLTRRVGHPGYHWSTVLHRAVRFVAYLIGALAIIVIPLFYTQILGVADPPNRPVITVDNLWMMLIFLALLLAVLWLARTRMLREAALGIAISSVIILDLFSATMPFNPTEEDLVASYREPEITAFLSEQWEADGPFRIDVRHPGLLPNFGAIEGFQSATGVFDPMQPAAYATAQSVLAEEPGLSAYDMLNVRYWITPADAEAPGGFEPVFESSSGNRIWERPGALPRVWFVADAVEVEASASLDLLRNPEFDPSTQVILERADHPVEGDSAGEAEIVSYSSEEITIQVDADGPGFVVLSEGIYPGWAAEIDSESTPLLVANHGIRAIPVDESSGVIIVRYEPGVVTVGVIAAGLGGLLLIGMVAGPFIVGRVPTSRFAGGER